MGRGREGGREGGREWNALRAPRGLQPSSGTAMAIAGMTWGKSKMHRWSGRHTSPQHSENSERLPHCSVEFVRLQRGSFRHLVGVSGAQRSGLVGAARRDGDLQVAGVLGAAKPGDYGGGDGASPDESHTDELRRKESGVVQRRRRLGGS